MRFEILGPVRASTANGPVAVTGRERVLLAVLLLHANEFVHANRLVDAIWGDQPPRNARNQLQSCVYRLRKRLAAAGVREQLITTDAAGYKIWTEAESLDLLQFRRLVADARAAVEQRRHHDAVTGYRAALALWRGPALSGIEDGAVGTTAAAIEEERLHAAEERVELELALGGAGELVAELTELVAQHPYRERLHAALMIALYRAGRQADALAAYQHARRLLVDEVGTEPGLAMRDLHQRILNNDQALMAAPPTDAEPSTPAIARHCLPRAAADFTGRPEAVARLVDAVQATPRAATVLAIDGMAGIGKTTLAVHVAHLLADRYPDGQLFVDLHGHSERRPMEPATALGILLRQLGVPGGRIPTDPDDRVALWRSELAERQVLVVLDNAASTTQVTPLLPAGPGCLVLVTSRRRLTGLDATRPLSLDVLSTDEAVELLAQIAGDRVRDEPEAAIEVAGRCGNLPLAIWLAGTRLAHRQSWRIRDMAERLRNAHGLLDELAAEDHTVADVFAFSYEQLPADLQRVFRLIGLHPGDDFDAYAVAALADSGLAEAQRALESLVDQHLVQEPRPGRYRLHDLVKEYAHRIASTDAGVRAAVERMLDFYLHAAAVTSAPMERPANRRSVLPEKPMRPELAMRAIKRGPRWLELERSNLVAAVRLAAAGSLDRYAWQIARAAWAFLYHQGYVDDLLDTHRIGLAAAERLEDDRAVATMCNYLASAHAKIGEFGEAELFLERALAIRLKHDDRGGAATTQMNLALVYRLLGRLDDAVRLNRQALAVRQRIRDLSGMGSSLQNLGIVYMMLGEYRAAARCHRRRLAISREIGDLAGAANPLGDLGAIRIRLGEHGMARRLLTASLWLRRSHAQREGEAEVVNDLGVLYRATGRHDKATTHHHEALAIAEDIGDRLAVCATRNELGRTLRVAGDPSGALEQHREVLVEATKIKLKYEQARALDGIAACLRDTEPAAARQHWQRALVLYREMGVPQQAEVERALTGLSQALSSPSESRIAPTTVATTPETPVDQHDSAPSSREGEQMADPLPTRLEGRAGTEWPTGSGGARPPRSPSAPPAPWLSAPPPRATAQGRRWSGRG